MTLTKMILTTDNIKELYECKSRYINSEWKLCTQQMISSFYMGGYVETFILIYIKEEEDSEK